MRSGMPKDVSSALLCDPGRTVAQWPSTGAIRSEGLTKGGLDEWNEGRIAVRSIDEDQTPRVFQFALDGHEVEFPLQADPGVGSEAHVLGIFVESFLDEVSVEFLIAVGQERDQ